MRTEQQIINTRRWIAGLRSGEFPQGVGFLNHTKRGFCCLGVACELANLPMAPMEAETTLPYNGVMTYMFYDESHQSVVFPEDDWFSKEFGLDHELTCELRDILASLNDDGISFEDIADVIEWCLLPGEC